MTRNIHQLAAQLRGVHARRSARAERENEGATERGGVPLEDILHVLDDHVGTGSALDTSLKELAAQTRVELKQAQQQARADTGGSLFLQERFLPSDPLLKKLTKFFGENFLNGVPDDVMPQAIAAALANQATVGGIVEPEKVREKLGATAFNVLLQAKLEATKPRAENGRGRGVREYLDPLTLHKLGRSAKRQTHVDRMPALSTLADRFGGPKALDGFRMTSIQHLFPSTLGLYDVLDQSGLDRALLGVGGKDYSSNPKTVTRMQADGYDVHWRAEPRAYAVAQSAEKEAAEMAKDQLARLFSDVTPEELNEVNPPRRFLLLDDGGKLIRALHQHFPLYAKLAVAIEQTDRGIQLIEDMQKAGQELLVPVVNMARSEAKKEAEGPIIGESVAFHADIEMQSLGPNFKIEPKVATILGYGAVGRATAHALQRRGYSVVVHDPHPAAQTAAKADGFEVLDRGAALAKGKLVVGATGRGVLDPSAFDELRDGAILVNAASRNHEFGLDAFDEKTFAESDPLAKEVAGQVTSTFGGQSVALGNPSEGSSNLHRVIRTKGGKEVMALRSGAVINMTLGLPPEYAQLTLGLLLAGTLTAATATTPGLVEIPKAMQDHVVNETKADLATRGLDLDAPDFRTLDPWPA